MNEKDKQLMELLQVSFPTAQAPLAQDLWPVMLKRLDRRPPAFSPLEWLFSALVLLAVLLFPQAAVALLYHL